MAPDLRKAQALIAASGTRGQTVVVWSARPYFDPQARYLVSLLKRLGYRARLHSLATWATYATALNRTPTVQAGFVIWFVTPLAADMLGTLSCDFEPNWAHFCDHRIDAEVAGLAKDEPSDPAGTADRATAIDRELTDAAPLVPLFNARFVYLTSARVGNYQVNTGSVLLDQLWVR